MRLGRLILVVATLITILVFPLVARDALQTVRLPNAYAQAQTGLDPAGTVMQNDDDDGGDDGDDDNGGNDDNDNDDESDNEGEDNENDGDIECYLSLNSNEEVPCDFDTNDNRDRDDDDGGVVRRVEDRRSNESVNRPTKCFDTREVGVVQLGTGSYDVTVQVMPHSSFNQTTRMTLRSLSPSSVPAPTGGTLVDSVVYQLDAQAGCDGVSIGQLPNNVNMGIIYNVPNVVDKSKLQIVRLEGGSWVNVDTVPDPVPGNPYVSTTINVAGTYALIQRP